MSLAAWIGTIIGVSANPLNFVPAFIIGATCAKFRYAAIGALILAATLAMAAYQMNKPYGGVSAAYIPAQFISSFLLVSAAFGIRHLIRGRRKGSSTGQSE